MPVRDRFDNTASRYLRHDTCVTIIDNTFGIVMRDILGRISLDGLTRPVGAAGARVQGGEGEVTLGGWVEAVAGYGQVCARVRG